MAPSYQDPPEYILAPIGVGVDLLDQVVEDPLVDLFWGEDDDLEDEVGNPLFFQWLQSSDEDEDEDEDWDEGEEDDQLFPPEEFWHGWRFHAAASPPPAFGPEEEFLPFAVSSGYREEDEEEDPSSQRPSSSSGSPILGSALDPLPVGGSKRCREEDEEEYPSSKHPRLSSSSDSPDNSSPSTSAVTSGGYFYLPHLLQDPESDED